ncbi:MAG: hypothetical protein IT331_11005, partial [Anaerolineae bacterium]|nr:hypothetical protein [Anaerolineae bacterium]
MSHRNLRQILSVFGSIILLGVLAISQSPPARAAIELVPASGLLNPDGTLNLAAHPHGTIDLRGWNVTLDTARGPLFAPASGGANAPNAIGDWSALGDDGSSGGSLTDVVNAIAVSGTDLYVGGEFTDVNNGGSLLTAADYIAKWDGTNWSALGNDGSSGGSLNAVVNALAVSGTDLYVGGRFTDVNNGGSLLTAADYVAKWDGTNWSALGNDGSSGGSLNNWVNALAVSGNNLYVGGEFTDVNNGGSLFTAADYVAKWDGTNWSALGNDGGSTPNGSLNFSINAIAVSGTDLYVGGGFTDVNNGGSLLTAADYIAKWDGTNWSALG